MGVAEKEDFTLGVPELEATKEENDPSNRDKNQIRTKKKYIPNRFFQPREKKSENADLWCVTKYGNNST